MSTEMPPDPTGELRREHRKLRVTRRVDVITGILEIIFGVGGVLFFPVLLGYSLWIHSTDWFRYSLSVVMVFFCAWFIRLGWLSLHAGRRAITSAELTKAKQDSRRELRQAAQGDLPIIFSKRSRYYALGMLLLFGVAGGYGWYLVATTGANLSALSLSLTGTIISIFYLYRFLVTFTGKIYQRESGAELRHILQIGEFTSSDEQQEK